MLEPTNNLYTISSSIGIITATCAIIGAVISSIISYVFVKNQLARQNDILNARTIQAYKENKEAQDLDIQRLKTDIADIKKIQNEKAEVAEKEIDNLKKRVAELESDNAKLVSKFSVEPYQKLDKRMNEFETRYDGVFLTIKGNQEKYIADTAIQTQLFTKISEFLTKNMMVLNLIESKLTTTTTNVTMNQK